MICGKRSNQEEVFAHIEVIEWTYTTLFYPEFILFLEVLFSCVMEEHWIQPRHHLPDFIFLTHVLNNNPEYMNNLAFLGMQDSPLQ